MKVSGFKVVMTPDSYTDLKAKGFFVGEYQMLYRGVILDVTIKESSLIEVSNRFDRWWCYSFDNVELFNVVNVQGLYYIHDLTNNLNILDNDKSFKSLSEVKRFLDINY